MKRCCEYEINRLYDGISSNKYYGDWNSPAGSRSPEGAALSSTMYAYHVCTLMAKISGVLKKDKDSEYFYLNASKIREKVTGPIIIIISAL